MKNTVLYLLLLVSFNSFSNEIPHQFKIKCELRNEAYVLAYDRNKYPDYFLIGVGDRARSTESMASFKLKELNVFNHGSSDKSLVVNYTAHYNYNQNEENFTVFEIFNDDSVRSNIVTIDKKSGAIKSISSLTSPSNCVSIGIW
ncbi:hypothetical protein HWV00_21260 (plasmid) [Moritella sp. 24]|uniref:hypothetical protein n=1 Tax=Moritella sp. 24 TaxID=2746230 RepID=UPI001BAAA0C8|nr:hypothetical protein [Moritella sp. 24]QUM78805.1 hypothetical protein HWV00_21260 [Moritella sp. 24]